MSTLLLMGVLLALILLQARDARNQYMAAWQHVQLRFGNVATFECINSLMRLEEEGMREEFASEIRKVFQEPGLSWIHLHGTVPQINEVRAIWEDVLDHVVDPFDVFRRRRLMSHLHLLESYALICKRGLPKAVAESTTRAI